jgi:hypothetical protein
MFSPRRLRPGLLDGGHQEADVGSDSAAAAGHLREGGLAGGGLRSAVPGGGSEWRHPPHPGAAADGPLARQPPRLRRRQGAPPCVSTLMGGSEGGEGGGRQGGLKGGGGREGARPLAGPRAYYLRVCLSVCLYVFYCLGGLVLSVGACELPFSS